MSASCPRARLEGAAAPGDATPRDVTLGGGAP